MAVPTRPVQDAIIDPAWGQWVHDETLRGLTIRTRNFDGATFDGNGLFTVTAADMGLTAISGLVWNAWINLNPTGQTAQLVPGQAFRASPTTYVLPMHVFQHPNGTMSRIGTTPAAVYVVAWGTVAATLLPAPDEPPALAKPAPDEEAEPK